MPDETDDKKLPLGELEYYVYEDYPVRPEIQ